MKAIWSIVSILAVANLLALLGFAGWLGSTGRLSRERIQAVREVLQQSPDADSGSSSGDGADQPTDSLRGAGGSDADGPPLAAEDRLQIRIEQTEADRMRMERLRREAEELKATLARERADLERERATFEAERDAFEKVRARAQSEQSSEQFKIAVGVLEGVKAPEARQMLQQYIDSQREDQVVAYLVAMDERARNKIIREFVKDDPKVAGDLLERIRIRGLGTAAGGTPAQ